MKKIISEKNKKKIIGILITFLIIVSVVLGIMLYKKQEEYTIASENDYNMSFYELIDYVENVKTYLAKSLISTTSEHGAETLTHVWREANLAQSYLAKLPIESQELENTEKFLNQVSDYSYALSRKNIYNQSLTEEDLKNLKELYKYSIDLQNTLNQLSEDLNYGRISWKDLTSSGDTQFAQQVSNISKDVFSNLESNFHEYSGLIYDGAFSEHMTSGNKKGLTGNDIDEETAKKQVEEFIGKEKIKEISNLGLSENADIPEYGFSIKTNEDNNIVISISKKGGHIISMNYNRDVVAEVISQEEANNIGKNFLSEKGFPNMKETYFLKQQGIVTINYAYEQDGVVVYPDLIKVKVALDNGEILGIEATGYLNCHEKRDVSKVKITKDDAKKILNKNLEIKSEGLAIIPTEWQTEVLCYEFKGTIDETDFLVYINAQNGKEEDILVIINTPDGTLTM